MSKSLYIAEKPSVAQQFAAALHVNGRRADGYIESENAVITWCVGHLVTMSYPEAYDPKYRRWSLETLPFLPREFKYEVIPAVAKQFQTVSGLLNRPDVDTIYICTDSGREGEYIYRLVDQMAGVHGKTRKRVWIDSQTEEEILRGIREAKDWSDYDNLSASAYLRAKEDYLMGINFSRLLTLKYGPCISSYLRTNRTVLSVGRVMTCVLGMVVRREREIREFVKTPFYRVVGGFGWEDFRLEGEWRSTPGSRYYQSPVLYKENGFKEKKTAQELVDRLQAVRPAEGLLRKAESKKETRKPPLLYNLAELQNDCSKMFKISPDETLKIVQELYEKKLVTYPRTDARVLSTAVAKEITKNLSGLKSLDRLGAFAAEILEQGSWKNLSRTRYVNDKQITDHYAIIPTGQGQGALRSLKGLSASVYEVICRRFLSIFYPAAVYRKFSLEIEMADGEQRTETFFAGYRVLEEPGYLKVAAVTGKRRQKAEQEEEKEVQTDDPAFIGRLQALKKGDRLPLMDLAIREGETSPPKRYTSGSMILAMENAGQLIEDEELRAQIKGSGIGTSATRAEILKKLVNIKYLALNGKTQVITPTLLGELVFDTVNASIRQLLNPELTASWEKGLTYVAEGSITSEEYMEKLEKFVAGRTYSVLKLRNQSDLRTVFDAAAVNYK
ncbi:MAG TPA: type IA DNA topoisomerase [Candidatus Lachnoclostridium stercoripullorum]|uniref:DNA topoisomerase n=1 Tax=Candidatus Lachnoclostridium stercoripullorum TaxID=2838635 RepID=A0A9D1W485_9FIRM|nr:type IA DNA topoisomerase [Candidatus Lachnoclostridium stercoripullorum]